MPTAALGLFDISGTDEAIAKVRKAYNRSDPRPDAFLVGRVTVNFVSTGMKRSDGGIAWAITSPSSRLIRMRDALDYPVQQAFLHETGHMTDNDLLSLHKAKRADIRALMHPVPTRWGDTIIAGVDKDYRALPSECFAESWVEAISDIETSLDGWYQRNIRDADLPKVLAIVQRVEPPDPVPEIPPPPEPIPPPPPELEPVLAELAAVRAALVLTSTEAAALKATIAAAREVLA